MEIFFALLFSWSRSRLSVESASMYTYVHVLSWSDVVPRTCMYYHGVSLHGTMYAGLELRPCASDLLQLRRVCTPIAPPSCRMMIDAPAMNDLARRLRMIDRLCVLVWCGVVCEVVCGSAPPSLMQGRAHTQQKGAHGTHVRTYARTCVQYHMYYVPRTYIVCTHT